MSRWSFRPTDVRVRVTAAATLAALVVLILGSLLFLISLRGSLERGLETTSSQQVSSVQAQLNAGEDADQVVITGKNDILVQVIGPDGTVVATDHPRVTTPMLTSPGADRHVQVRGLEDSYVAVARHEKGGDRLIAVGHSSEGITRALQAVTVLLVVAVPCGLALLALVVWLSVGRALRPVEAMRREATDITDARADRRLAVPESSDEISRLAITLNEMLDRIDASHRLQRQFVSDASHELRSPLASLRQLAEMARDYPDDSGNTELARDVLTEEQRMERLVTALLLLARLDDEAPPPPVPVDLDDLVIEEVRRVHGRGDDVAIDASAVGSAQVEGDPVLMAQVVRNLVSNAVRHARSQVHVSLREVGSTAELVVDDDGGGVPPEERERIFERFVRLDEARARDDGGSGLGLAIVAKIVHSFGGTVAVAESPSGGARFTATLPLEVGTVRIPS